MTELDRARRVAARWAPLPWSTLTAPDLPAPSKVWAFIALCRRFLARPSNRPLARAVLREHTAALGAVIAHTASHHGGLDSLSAVALRALKRPVKPIHIESLARFRGALLILSAAAIERAKATHGSADSVPLDTLERAHAVLQNPACERVLEQLCLRSMHAMPVPYEHVLFSFRLRYAQEPDPCPTPTPETPTPTSSPTSSCPC